MESNAELKLKSPRYKLQYVMETMSIAACTEATTQLTDADKHAFKPDQKVTLMASPRISLQILPEKKPASSSVREL